MIDEFKERLRKINCDFVRFETLQTLQINLGNLCNLNCAHCHVEASPSGGKIMSREVIDKIVTMMERIPGITLDMTGGCPEMNPHFRRLVEKTADLSPRRIVRSNLTILNEPGYKWLPGFFREQRLVVAASLPCYLEANVDRQRGQGTHARCMAALRRLNSLGYGDDLELNLVYNPGDDSIPGSQKNLETAYKQVLKEKYGIFFSNLFVIANAPIGRFRKFLEAEGIYDRYLNLLAASFNQDAAKNIMCRTLISIDWEGILYNCDFNQAIGLPITGPTGEILKIEDLEAAAAAGKELFLSQHCYCCTAGEGSSCTGALVA